MDLLHLVDRLEELVGSAQKMPIGSRAMVDRRRLLDIIDQMRVVIPSEVRQAQELVAQRDSIIREAEEEARLIVAHAEERAERLVATHDITERARRRAEEIAEQAQDRLEEQIRQANADIEERLEESRRLSGEQLAAADEYALELLTRLERQLQAFVRSVHSGIRQLEPLTDEEGAASEREEGEEREPVAAVWREGAGDGNRVRRRDAEARFEPTRFDTRDLPEPEPEVIDDFSMPPLDDQPPLNEHGWRGEADDADEEASARWQRPFDDRDEDFYPRR